MGAEVIDGARFQVHTPLAFLGERNMIGLLSVFKVYCINECVGFLRMSGMYIIGSVNNAFLGKEVYSHYIAHFLSAV